MTRDGLLHVVVNDGSAFSIMSQVHLDDGSISWVETARFIGINDLDTSDLVLQEDTLYFANSAKGRRIDIRSLDYDQVMLLILNMVVLCLMMIWMIWIIKLLSLFLKIIVPIFFYIFLFFS